MFDVTFTQLQTHHEFMRCLPLHKGAHVAELDSIPSVDMNATPCPPMPLEVVYNDLLAIRWVSFVLAILGASSNLFTLICIIRFRILRCKVTNVFIANLCACDILLAVTPSISAFMDDFDKGRSSRAEMVVASCAVAVLYQSLFIILLIGVDRAIAIADPVGYRLRMTHRRSAIILAVMWVGSTAAFLGLILPYQLKRPSMHHFFPANSYSFFILPLTVIVIVAIVVLYIGILVEFLRQRRKICLRFSGHFLPAFQRTRSLTRMTLIILLIFMSTWLPALVVTAKGPPGREAPDTLLHDTSPTFCSTPVLSPTA
jgi:hypothetical protein